MSGCSKRSDAFCDTKLMELPCKQDGEKRQSVIKQTFERKHLVIGAHRPTAFPEPQRLNL